jgi:uncharacterized protein
MRMRIVTLAGLSLLLAGPAAAASFDCHKDRTPFAKAICAHPALSRADDELAASFAAALKGLSPGAQAEVQQAQDAWVKYANIACTNTARPATTPYRGDDIDCLEQLFKDRTSQLANDRTIGGLRFYYIDRYAALPDPKPAEDNAFVATKSVSTPRIDGSDAEARAFNSFIETGTVKDIDPAIATHPGDGTQDNADSLIVTTVTPARITMTLNASFYPHGAAHGSYGITYIHYLRGQQRRLVASDIFATPGWQAKLQAIALPAAKKQEGENLLLDDPNSIKPLVIDPARWDFSRRGLILQFEPYEIAAFAFGTPTVTIPWSDLDGLLAPGAVDFEN